MRLDSSSSHSSRKSTNSTLCIACEALIAITTRINDEITVGLVVVERTQGSVPNARLAELQEVPYDLHNVSPVDDGADDVF